MILFEIQKYIDCNEIAWMTIFGQHIDFRDWYVVECHDEGFSVNGWSDSWFTHSEIKDILEDEPDLVYKKVSKWRTCFRPNSHTTSFFKSILFFTLGFVVSVLWKKISR